MTCWHPPDTGFQSSRRAMDYLWLQEPSDSALMLHTAQRSIAGCVQGKKDVTSCWRRCWSSRAACRADSTSALPCRAELRAAFSWHLPSSRTASLASPAFLSLCKLSPMSCTLVVTHASYACHDFIPCCVDSVVCSTCTLFCDSAAVSILC